MQNDVDRKAKRDHHESEQTQRHAEVYPPGPRARVQRVVFVKGVAVIGHGERLPIDQVCEVNCRRLRSSKHP